MSTSSLTSTFFYKIGPTDLLRRHIWRLSRYFWSIFPKCPDISKVKIYTASVVPLFLKFKSLLLAKRISLLNAVQILNLATGRTFLLLHRSAKNHCGWQNVAHISQASKLSRKVVKPLAAFQLRTSIAQVLFLLTYLPNICSYRLILALREEELPPVLG
jgi:hypothetical protein